MTYICMLKSTFEKCVHEVTLSWSTYTLKSHFKCVVFILICDNSSLLPAWNQSQHSQNNLSLYIHTPAYINTCPHTPIVWKVWLGVTYGGWWELRGVGTHTSHFSLLMCDCVCVVLPKEGNGSPSCSLCLYHKDRNTLTHTHTLVLEREFREMEA